MNSEYKNLNVLLQELSKGLDSLASGQLSLADLDTLLQDAREFHERIAILQYLSVQPKQNLKKDIPKKKKEMGALNFSFDFADEEKKSTNQTNLLDAIEETPEIKGIIQKKEAIITTPAINIDTKETQANSTEDIETPSAANATTQLPKSETSENAGSINDQFSKNAAQQTLADKLGKSPIPNLIDAIGLNQKFLFMNDLFEGENNLYKEAINNLNNFPNFIAADEYLNTLKSRHNWDTTHDTAKKFEELVVRRYS